MKLVLAYDRLGDLFVSVQFLQANGATARGRARAVNTTISMMILPFQDKSINIQMLWIYTSLMMNLGYYQGRTGPWGNENLGQDEKSSEQHHRGYLKAIDPKNGHESNDQKA